MNNRSKNILVLYLSALLFHIFPYFSQGQDGQNIRFDRYTSENVKLVKGLSQNWIYKILQDRDGYIWFGTWDGLNKFDGYNFTIYNVNDGLSDHTILTLLEDENGDIWIGTNKGLSCFVRKSQSFVNYETLPGDSTSLYKNRVNAMIMTRDSSLWLGTGGGLCRFDRQTKQLQCYMSTPQEYTSPRSNYILDLLELSDGNIMVATTYGLVVFEPATGRSTRYYHDDDDPQSLSDNNVRCLMQDRDGSFWIGTRNGLNVYDTVSKTLKRYFNDPADPKSIGSDYVRVIFQDRAGNIWVGTDGGGLALYNYSEDNFIRYTNELDDRNSLSNDKVYEIFEDRSGNLWVGTFLGVNKINKYTNNFGLMQQTSTAEEGGSINNNFIWSFEEDNSNNLWIGTSRGVNIQNPVTKTYHYLVHEPGNIKTIAGNEVRALLYSEKENCMWLGLYGTGVDCYDFKTGEIKHFIPNPRPNSISNIYVNDLLEDKNGNIWIATGKGLNYLNPNTSEIKIYEHIPNDSNSLSNSIIISLFEDVDGFLWVGTDNGLNKFIPEENRFEKYFNNSDFKIADRTIFYIYQDKSKRFWLGTSGGGLVRFDAQTKAYRVYTVADQMPNDIIYGILEDDDKNLWFTTNRGLVKFYVIGERIVTYDVKDGIQSYEFNLGSCFKDKKGVMYFGGMNGFNYFHPDEIISNPTPPVVVFTAFRKFNERQPVELENDDTIRLKYDENFFSFEISALDYTNPSKNKYRYFLQGVDNDWLITDANERLAEYKNVHPGSYTFYANGSNNDGIWNEDGIMLTIIIKPAWYASWWFRLILFVVVISLLWLLIYQRLRRIRKKHEVERRLLDIEKQKFQLEQQALRLQMNPHFIFNSLNSIQSYILTHDTELAVTYLGKFSQLMRLILANSGSNSVPFREELKSIRHYLDLEKLRFDNKFEYNIKVDPNIDEEFIEIPPMVIQPYVENAIIHGLLHKEQTGRLEIEFKLHKSTIYCSITDDGVGREKSKQLREQQGIHRKSTGMHITKARLEMLNKRKEEDFTVRVTDLKDKKGNAIGTKVELNIQFYEDQ